MIFPTSRLIVKNIPWNIVSPTKHCYESEWCYVWSNVRGIIFNIQPYNSTASNGIHTTLNQHMYGMFLGQLAKHIESHANTRPTYLCCEILQTYLTPPPCVLCEKSKRDASHLGPPMGPSIYGYGPSHGTDLVSDSLVPLTMRAPQFSIYSIHVCLHGQCQTATCHWVGPPPHH